MTTGRPLREQNGNVFFLSSPGTPPSGINRRYPRAGLHLFMQPSHAFRRPFLFCVSASFPEKPRALRAHHTHHLHHGASQAEQASPQQGLVLFFSSTGQLTTAMHAAACNVHLHPSPSRFLRPDPCTCPSHPNLPVSREKQHVNKLTTMTDRTGRSRPLALDCRIQSEPYSRSPERLRQSRFPGPGLLSKILRFVRLPMQPLQEAARISCSLQSFPFPICPSPTSPSFNPPCHPLLFSSIHPSPPFSVPKVLKSGSSNNRPTPRCLTQLTPAPPLPTPSLFPAGRITRSLLDAITSTSAPMVKPRPRFLSLGFLAGKARLPVIVLRVRGAARNSTRL